jgi:hypothetical protein
MVSHEANMSVSYIQESVKIRLWGKSAGRCQFDGCNKPLWQDGVTQVEFNTAYIAHIIADKPDGPRGDPVLSEQLKNDISNLMLLCDVHHRQIDKIDVAGHSVDLLRAMKARHESRIELVGSLGPDRQSHVLLYGANVGDHNTPLSLTKAAKAMLPDRYPAEPHPIALGIGNSAVTDRDAVYWESEALQLARLFAQQVKPRLAQGHVDHLSVFALAPQPLLMKLGYLLSDIPAAEVFQLHREPPDWCWQTDAVDFDYVVTEPANLNGPPALVFSLSATVTNNRIERVLPNAAIWQMTAPVPGNDFLKGRAQARLFRERVRHLLDRIKAVHGHTATLSVFPAMPVALAVDFGRVIMPKADLKMEIYDENRNLGGFERALSLP